MPIDLADVARPAHTAVLTMEIQRGVVGDLSAFPELADAAAKAGVIPNTARLVSRARQLGVPVIHCTAEFRPDRAGTAVNTQLIAAALRNPDHMLAGTPPAELVPELGPAPSDLVSSRLSGVSPFIGTSLDTWLRNLGVRTVVATGLSVNLGVLGLVIEAVNLGYQVVVPRDAVAGIPEDYAESVLKNTFPLVATLTTVNLLLDAWSA
ncbi:MAG TPA: cysteine hydrolase [Acidimicrobiales bacterium]|nr:cysteine hydrolase [Acidimicrobiales bacterium]